MKRSLSLWITLAAAGPVTRAAADDWPHWRGPARNGISAESGWLDRWPADGPPVAWTAEVGTGYSTFAVAKGRVFTTGNSDGKDTVFCIDADTGRSLWSHAYPSDLEAKYFDGGPTATPTVDGERVYTLSRWGDLFCIEAATGKIAWSKNVQKETGLPVPSWGFGGSPLVHDDLLILNLGEGGLALEKAGGRVAWKSGLVEPGYSTPLPVKRGDRQLVLLSTGESYLAVEPRTGREAWRIPWVTEYGVNAADPIVDGDRLFLSSGYDKGAALFTLGKDTPRLAWENRVLRCQMNPPVLLDGHLYGVDGNTTDRAKLKCVELATGAEKWSREDFGTGAVTAADGRLIALSARGELLVAPASPQGFEPTASATILRGRCWTVPVLANGRIYARNSAGRVVCVDVRKK
jgi:outer membrane protein assembly factor BamB